MDDARPLDELANDLAANHVRYDNSFDSCRIHSIIQGCGAARTRQRGKPGAQRGLLSYKLAHEHIGPLRTAPETALPGELRAVPRAVRL